MAIDSIKQDFKLKQKEYHHRNYGIETKKNYLRRFRNQIIREMASKANSFDHVLDIGCGPAILYEDLLDRCTKYYAFDVVESNLEQLQLDFTSKKIEPILGNLDTFKWQQEPLDLIICSGSLEYTNQPASNIMKLLGWLRPGGLFIASFPNIHSPYRLWSEYIYKYIWRLHQKLRKESSHTYPRKLFNPTTIQNTIQTQQGVTEMANRYVGLKLLLQPLDTLFEDLDHRIIKRYEQKPTSFLNRFSQEFILFIRT